MNSTDSVRVSKIYYGLTADEATKRYLSYSSNKYNLKGVNTTLDGLKRFIRDNDMQDLITHYAVLDPSIFDIDDSVDYDYKYNMISVKIPLKFRIDRVYELDVSK